VNGFGRPVDARPTEGLRWIVDTTSVAAGLAEAAHRLAAYCRTRRSTAAGRTTRLSDRALAAAS
jgi:hypothetical protein